MSRFDYRDPGADPAYCNALAADDDEHEPALGFPKPTPRLQARVHRRLLALSKARAFRALVWARDKGMCRFCHQRVRRTVEMHPLRGEVHHLRGRRVAPEDRYSPDAAVLLCLEHHEQAQRHEIVIAQPESSR